MSSTEYVQILDETARIRIAELETEKVKSEAAVNTHRQRMAVVHNIGLSSVLACILGFLAFQGFSCHRNDELEETRRIPEVTRQLVEKTRHLKAILDIAKNSDTDELAAKAFEAYLKASPKKKRR